MNRNAKIEQMIKLKNLRKMRGLTQGDLAWRIGAKNANTIYQYEAGVRSPSVKTLRKIAQALECTIDDICG